MYKTETHLHTAPVSNCSRISPEEMIRLYHEAGYKTVFVSDHFARFHFNKMPEEFTWSEKTGLLYGAYEKAKAAGEILGMHVLFTPELTLDGNHYLLYGADRAFLDLREDIFTMSLPEFRKHADEQGITVIQAHPLRDGKFVPHPEYVDGFEVINSNPRHENFNDKVYALAAAHGLPMTAGSDAHLPEDIALSAMISDEPITSVEQYIDLLLAGKLRLMLNGRIL